MFNEFLVCFNEHLISSEFLFWSVHLSVVFKEIYERVGLSHNKTISLTEYISFYLMVVHILYSVKHLMS